MKKNIYFFILITLLASCASKDNIIYLQDLDSYQSSKTKSWVTKNFIQPNDLLKIEVFSNQDDLTLIFNKKNFFNNQQSAELLKLGGYLVSSDYKINFPVLGMIEVKNKSIPDLEKFISQKLINDKQLTNAIVSIRNLNSKFTILGEVASPGTYTFYENEITLLQAIGYAGDLTTYAKRKEIRLIREVNGVRKIKILDLTSSDVLYQDYYIIKNNDIIIINPNFSKVKSSGFIGSAQSIASFASLFISITILLFQL
tara:strand:- start:2547 stop:3314 length:768 start_codon:yes stop_codon:yes gene_type:complete